MPTSPIFGWTLPDSSSAGDVPFFMDALADGVEATIDDYRPKIVNIASNVLGANWNIIARCSATKRSDGKFIVTLWIQGIRTTATLAVSATAYSNLGVLFSAATYRPADTVYVPGTLVVATGNTQEFCMVSISNATGEISIRGSAARTMASSGTDFFTATATWVTA